MKFRTSYLSAALGALVLTGLWACSSNTQQNSSVHIGVGASYYDPWYYGGSYRYYPPAVVAPPPGRPPGAARPPGSARPPVSAQPPIARPPSVPSRPRPTPARRR